MTAGNIPRASLVDFEESSQRLARASGSSTLPWLTRSRLAPPRLVDAIARGGLLKHCIDPACAGGMLLLLAPPGYGKTTLLAQLHAALFASGRNVAWLTLSEQENAPDRFIEALEHAVARGLKGLNASPSVLSRTPEQRLGELLDALAQHGPAHLLLDDIDVLRDRAVLQMLDGLAEHLPPGIMLCLSGHRYASSRFKKLLSESRARILTAEDLRFEPMEVEKILARLSPADAARATAMTSGFPLACRLMSRQLEDNLAPDAARAFDRMRPAIGEWFEEQVLSRTSPDELAFLMDSGVLAQFTLEILESVPDRRYTWSHLQSALNSGCYLGAIETQAGWFGYLPLFAQHLTELLRRCDPSRLAMLHRFAADWFTRHEQPIDAIRHASETGDPIFAAEITEKLGAIRLGFEKGAWIMAYSRDLPPRCMHEFPLVALGQIYLSVEEGHFSEARAAFERLKQSPGVRRVLTREDPWTTQIGTLALLVEEVLRIYEDQPVTAREIETLEQCLRNWLHGPPILAASVASALSAIYVSGQRFEDAARTADRGRIALRDAGPCQASFVLRIMGALSALALGHLREAALQIECAAQAAAGLADPKDKQTRYTDLVKAQLHYEANELEAAWSILEAIPSRPEMLMNAWFDLQAGVFDAAAALAGILEGPEAVRAVVHEAQRIARARNMPRLKVWSEVLLLREFVREGRHREAFDMLEGENLHTLLDCSAETAPDNLRIRTELLIAAAHLMVAVERYWEAEDYLSRLDHERLRSGDVRRRIAFGIAAMTIAFRLRRHAQACSHLTTVVMTGVETGMTRRLLEHKEQLLQVGNWMQRVGRQMPVKVAAFLGQIRGITATPRGERSSIYRIRSQPADLSAGGGLTRREAEVLTLLADGLTSKEIASRLVITEGTVKTHRKKINKKLNVCGRSHAVAAARKMLLA